MWCVPERALSSCVLTRPLWCTPEASAEPVRHASARMSAPILTQAVCHSVGALQSCCTRCLRRKRPGATWRAQAVAGRTARTATRTARGPSGVRRPCCAARAGAWQAAHVALPSSRSMQCAHGMQPRHARAAGASVPHTRRPTLLRKAAGQRSQRIPPRLHARHARALTLPRCRAQRGARAAPAGDRVPHGVR